MFCVCFECSAQAFRTSSLFKHKTTWKCHFWFSCGRACCPVRMRTQHRQISPTVTRFLPHPEEGFRTRFALQIIRLEWLFILRFVCASGENQQLNTPWPSTIQSTHDSHEQLYGEPTIARSVLFPSLLNSLWFLIRICCFMTMFHLSSHTYYHNLHRCRHPSSTTTTSSSSSPHRVVVVVVLVDHRNARVILVGPRTQSPFVNMYAEPEPPPQPPMRTIVLPGSKIAKPGFVYWGNRV